LSQRAVVDTALEIVDEQGLEAVTLAAVAARAGVAAPSLYKHVASLAELRALIGARVTAEMAERLTTELLGLSGDEAVAALMRSTRAYVLEHPNRYAAMPLDPLHDPLTEQAGAKLLQVFLAVLRYYGLEDSAAIHAVRSVRALMHGFVSLEAGGGFGLPEDLDESYQRLTGMYIKSLPHKGERQ
jgi:AcrR family transcriptional regulator